MPIPETVGRILIIDDEPDVGRIMGLALEARGHSVELADDGARGLSEVGRTRPDVIVLDLMMPVLDGFAVMERLNRDEWTRHVPVVVLTAMTRRAVRDRCIELGAVEIVTKPFDPYLVADRIEVVLRRRASA